MEKVKFKNSRNCPNKPNTDSKNIAMWGVQSSSNAPSKGVACAGLICLLILVLVLAALLPALLAY